MYDRIPKQNKNYRNKLNLFLNWFNLDSNYYFCMTSRYIGYFLDNNTFRKKNEMDENRNDLVCIQLFIEKLCVKSF